MSIISSLQLNLLNIMAKLLMSLPVETLQEVPGYNTMQHMKALAAYKKIMKCSKNFEEFQKKRTSLKGTKSQSSGDISPFCLSPNDEHYRLSNHSQKSCSVEDMNTGVNFCERQEADTKMVPDSNAVISESMRISHCKKSLNFSSFATDVRNIDTQVSQICKGNIPTSSRTLPHGNSSEAVEGSAKSYQTNSCNLINTKQGVPLRKFSFGSHRKLASGSDNSTPAGNDKNSRFRMTNTTPLFSPMNISGASNSIASANTNTSGIGESDMKSLWQNDSELEASGVYVKTSAPTVHPQSVNFGK